MDYTDSPVLSPSKARQAASQARDWAYVTSWLKRKYSPNAVPPFERNEDTLKVLLNLAAANEAADEEEALLHRARLETIELLGGGEKSGADPRVGLVDGIEASLDHKGTLLLEDLAETTVALGALNPDVAELGYGITDLTREEFDFADQLRRVENLQNYLDQELESLGSQLDELYDETLYETPEDLPSKTDERLRRTKLLSTKVNDYHDRLAALKRTSETKGPRIGELVSEEGSVVNLKETVKALETRLRMFQGLPPNVRKANLEHERMSREHRDLLQKRDYMFDDMVDRGH